MEKFVMLLFTYCTCLFGVSSAVELGDLYPYGTLEGDHRYWSRNFLMETWCVAGIISWRINQLGRRNSWLFYLLGFHLTRRTLAATRFVSGHQSSSIQMSMTPYLWVTTFMHLRHGLFKQHLTRSSKLRFFPLPFRWMKMVLYRLSPRSPHSLMWSFPWWVQLSTWWNVK